MNPRALGIYVHLPFCVRKCHYCDFNSQPATQAQRAEYLRALRAEMAAKGRELERRRSVATIYFGGGTPTIYRGEELGELLGAITEQFEVARDAEVSIEANPESVDVRKLRRLRAAGFNRLSLGAQSFHDEELRMLGRGHTSADIVGAVGAAREAGFENVSLDLIYALPRQRAVPHGLGGTAEDNGELRGPDSDPAPPDNNGNGGQGQARDERWARTLARALRLRPEHLSAYGLSLEPGTPLARSVQAGELKPVGEEEHLAMRMLTREMCAAAGLRQYEISNYARPGCECRHNLVYWHNQEYLGLGAGACSYRDGVRWENLPDPGVYARRILSGEPAITYQERLDAEGRLFERVMLGLRLREGLKLASLDHELGEARVKELRRRAGPLVRAGLLASRDGWLRLTTVGMPLHSEICQRLV